MKAATPIRVAPPVTGRPCYNPCRLPYHEVGERVRWQTWDNETGQFVWNHGKVLVHAARTLVIEVHGGEQIRTSCGHVVRAK